MFLSDVCLPQTSPSIEFSVGLAFPSSSIRGDLTVTNDSGVSYISPDFIRNNYAISTGASITGTLKFPLEKKQLLSLIFTGSYTYFNAFRRSFAGTGLENNITVPVSYDNRFSTSTFGVGIETSPAVTSKVRPYLNASFSFNILSLNLSKNDAVSVLFNDAFRMGLMTGAGVKVKLGGEYSFISGVSYQMSNLFLKSHNNSYGQRIEFNTESVPINDEEGTFYTNLSDPAIPSKQVNGKTKSVNWLGFYVGLNIALGNSGKK